MFLCEILKLFILLISFFVYAVNAEENLTWSQVGPNDTLIIRTIIEEIENCPIAKIDDNELPMVIRAYRDSSEFPEKVCELTVKKSVKNITIDDHKVPTLAKSLNKVVIIGDTGCRSSLTSNQDCSSEEEWPLKKILSNVIQHQPDLVVHVGDYLYRESSLLSQKKYGDRLSTWEADWVFPAKELSHYSPFLFIRGNHEDCKRNYKGWFRYLDPHPFHKKCENFSKSWFFNDVGPIKFFIFDSSSIRDTVAYNSSKIHELNTLLSPLIKNNLSTPIWLLTHKPLWHYSEVDFLSFHVPYLGNSNQLNAIKRSIPKNLSVVLSGHTHLAEIIAFEDSKLPLQLIVGNSGAKLHNCSKKINKNVVIKGTITKNIECISGFGFAILYLDEKKITYYDKDNKEVYTLKLNI